jgi:hypothetical protein
VSLRSSQLSEANRILREKRDRADSAFLANPSRTRWHVSHEESLTLIRQAFAHVEIDKIVVENEPLTGSEIAKVFVRDDQLDAALADNGVHARRAAMETGIDVEVMMSPCSVGSRLYAHLGTRAKALRDTLDKVR